MSSSLYGYHGQYLRVDLTTGDIDEIPISSGVLKNFIGGSGLGTWLLLQESPVALDPLSSEAPLIFVFSPLVGSPLTTSAKFTVLAKSPLTNRINDSLSSSHFAISGKQTGYDAFVIVGAAERATCLVIDAEGVQFEDATSVWGQSSRIAAELLKDQIGSHYHFVAIGPAGENQVSYATISHEGRHAGRGGLGAVMGSKNLKAVAVHGEKPTPFAHPEKLLEYSRELSKKSLGAATAKYRELGTVSNLLTFNRLGSLPTRNFQSGMFEGAADLAPDSMAENHKRTRAYCAACTIGCEHIFQLDEKPIHGSADGNIGDAAPTKDENSSGVRMEYENLFALGPLCGISDPAIVLKASSICDDLGLDTISAGATVAFAMECAERGLIDEPDLRFGNGDALLETLHAIGTRTGLGELLTKGTRAAAAEIGQGSELFAPHVKGLEIPGYEPRALQTMALGFAVGTRGADHNRSSAYEVDFSEKVDRMHVGQEAVLPAIQSEDEAVLIDSLILCKFLRSVFDDKLVAMSEMYELVTGWKVSPDNLRETARRIVTAKKLYNILQGWQPEEDTLPKRFLSEALQEGASEGAMLSETQLKMLIRNYNLARGWSEAGWIDEEQLVELQIEGDFSTPHFQGETA